MEKYIQIFPIRVKDTARDRAHVCDISTEAELVKNKKYLKELCFISTTHCISCSKHNENNFQFSIYSDDSRTQIFKTHA
jgi:hypothetical protein